MSETNRCEGPSRTPVYYEDETSEPLGAQCKNASSDASKLATRTNDDTQMRDYLRTKAVDAPLEDDVIGNMIPGAIVGGVAGAVHHLAGTSAVSGIGAAVAEHAAKDVAIDAAKHAVMHAKLDQGPATASTGSASSSNAPRPSADVPGGVSKNGASMPVKEPTQSTPEPAPAGQDRSPYAPGYAPLRIPEAPTVIRG